MVGVEDRNQVQEDLESIRVSLYSKHPVYKNPYISHEQKKLMNGDNKMLKVREKKSFDYGGTNILCIAKTRL